MARTHHLFAAVGLSLLGLGTGCVSTEKYNAQRMAADQANISLSAADADANSAKAAQQETSRQNMTFKQMLDQKDAINQNLANENNDLRLQLTDARHQYETAMANIGKFGGSSLPVPLIGELTTLAQQNPDVVEFDEKKGLIKFKSDVTFSPGSAIVKPEIKPVIDRLAGILNGATASQYELMVVGHTDNMPVSNPATKKAGHLDNWYLSAHRAIAVSQTLIAQGTSSRRIEVAGCADQRPIAPNDSEANKGRNRRVEVFILPTTVGSSPAPTAPQPPVVQAPQPKRTTNLRKPLDKDNGATADVEKKPFLSK